MTSTRNWTLQGLLEQGSNFREAPRVSATSSNLTEEINAHREIPLVIEGFHKHPLWPQRTFTLDQFCSETLGDITVRNVHSWTDSTMPVKEFIARCRISSAHKQPGETERFYGKDAECPKSWEKFLQEGNVVPEILLSKGSEDIFQYLPDDPDATIETLMCYFGIGDTCTPCHKDLCASSGQNLMCYTERDGSSFWFMTESSSAPAVAKYFRDELGQELDRENHIITISELASAPFTVYVLQQKLGDMVLVPPRSCHQVMNAGGITVKTSWSRMTLEGLSVAYHYELPIYRRVCRPETYRVKSTVYHALTSLTNKLLTSIDNNLSTLRLVKDMKQLLALYDLILLEEYDPDEDNRKRVLSDSTTFNDSITCDFCSGDIFQSYFECRECCDNEGARCHLCPGCYVEGRICECGCMEPMQYLDFQHLIDLRTRAVDALNTYEENIRGQRYDFPLALSSTSSICPGYRLLFRAACILYKVRLKVVVKGVVRTCRTNGKSHITTYAIICKKCHFSKCFAHVLMDYSIHCSEALLLQSSDVTQLIYHGYHQGSKMRLHKKLAVLHRAEAQGTPSSGSAYDQLAFNALQHTQSRPMNQFMKPGWYDSPLHSNIFEIPEIEDTILHMSTPDRANLIPSTIQPQSGRNNTVSKSEKVSRSKLSKKRKFQVYVDVPEAAYAIKSAINRPAITHLETVPSTSDMTTTNKLKSTSVKRFRGYTKDSFESEDISDSESSMGQSTNSVL